MIFPIGDDQVKGGHFPLFSYAFIVLNVLVFLFEAQLSPDVFDAFLYQYGAIPAEIMQGQDLYTLGTSMFLHAGWMHLFGNMIFLWVFADNIEATIGSPLFLIFYIIGGLAAHAGHIYFNMGSGIPTVGASGAIAAVMGAYLVMFPRSRVKTIVLFFFIRIPAFLFLGFWIVQQSMNGMGSLNSVGESSNVAWWAHIGGFVCGAILGLFFRGFIVRKEAYAD